jgi:hypothetical protein
MTDIQGKARDLLEQLTPSAAQVILEQLADRIQEAMLKRATEINYPIEGDSSFCATDREDHAAVAWGRLTVSKRPLTRSYSSSSSQSLVSWYVPEKMTL